MRDPARAANTLASLSQPRLSSFRIAGRIITFECEVMPGRTDQLQFKDKLVLPVWNPFPVAVTQRAVGAPLTMSDMRESIVSTRFHRIVLLP